MASIPRSNTSVPLEASHLLNRDTQTLHCEVVRPRPPQICTEASSSHNIGHSVPSRDHVSPDISSSSTPPDSPTNHRISIVTLSELKPSRGGTITPPLTPSTSSHRKSSSTLSENLSPLSTLNRRVSMSFDNDSRGRTTELVHFPYQELDYIFQTNSDGKKRPIGEGCWSDVYLAKPDILSSVGHSLSATPAVMMSPPLTPVHSRGCSLSSESAPMASYCYAVKVPASTSAKKVLLVEAKILSYLSRQPDSARHVVPFYGLDTRNGGLILKAMDGTLESWIQKELNALDELSRAQRLAAIFPAIALSLFGSLQWLQDQGCVHADIKPSNILVANSSSYLPSIVFSDFSSTLLTLPGAEIDAEAPPAGAGTWEYLDPQLLTSKSTAPPSAVTDLWSLAITFLFLVLGTSPFDAFKTNAFQQREMIKHGIPLHCLGHDAAGIRNVKRLKALEKDLGFDVQKWFAKVLVKDPAKRVDLEMWKNELVAGLRKKEAKI